MCTAGCFIVYARVSALLIYRLQLIIYNAFFIEYLDLDYNQYYVQGYSKRTSVQRHTHHLYNLQKVNYLIRL